MKELRQPWMVAAWPGMGMVAWLAADYLARKLGAEPLAEVPAGDHFHPGGVQVQQGILLPPHRPKTGLSGWRAEHSENEGSGKSNRDLVILLGEQQPTAASWRYCESVLGIARELGVEKVFTFAAMATTSPPKTPARVFAAATDAAALSEVQKLGLETIQSGEIGGMNGVFLAAAAEQRLPGTCLLGEIPFFASAVANPKAAAAILRAFGRLTGIALDLSELDRAGAEVERQLAEHYEKLEEAARAGGQPEQAGQGEQGEEWKRPAGAEELSPADKARIEALFEEAQRDRSRALELKAVLDRLGVFKRYEDRFLDLFKRAE